MNASIAQRGGDKMADFYDRIDEERKAFIERQHMFFVATAPTDPEDADGFPNLSPKGRTLLRVLGPNLVGYLDYPGSGNETAKHIAQGSPVTLMLCSFEGTAGILRIYGRGRRVDLADPDLRQYQAAFRDDVHPFVRQAFFIDVEKLQTSCGYAVPRMKFIEDRLTLDKWCEKKLVGREIVDGLPAAGPLYEKSGNVRA
jgi:predicted pyridoxine 5'-phosphate oxidase superfamily flavin-nucleotide-binding protein